jgi:Uma2 family endonuclease
MTMTIAEGCETRRFTRAEYYRMAEMGFFEDQRVELIDGEILFMSPQNNPHAMTLMALNRLFSRALSDEFMVRPQLPLSVSDVSEPEPDLAIVREGPGVMRGEHPCTAELVIEISDSSGGRDKKKRGLYASAGIPEYWIVDVVKRKVHVHTEPASAPGNEFGAEYKQVRTFGIGDSVKPMALPVGEISVEQFFPKS